VIDLEDRFYSPCYATCGLPKRFELNGYNRWREMVLPKQILEKMCKKYGFQRPIFENGNLIKKHDVSGDFIISDRKKKPIYCNYV
jgi:hypothetical protein